MTVYIVMAKHHDVLWVDAVFDSEDAAKAHIRGAFNPSHITPTPWIETWAMNTTQDDRYG